MKKHAADLVLSATLGLICSLCFASPAHPSIDRLLDLSGATKQVGEFPRSIKAGFMRSQQQGGSIPGIEVSAILDSVDRTILPSAILHEIRASVAEDLSDAEIEALLKWYESDTGRRITAAEENASTPEANQVIINNAQSLLANGERVEVAMRFDELLGSTDNAVDLQKFSQISIYSALIAAVAPDQLQKIEDIKAQLEAIEPQLRANMRQFVILTYVYSYQSIDDASLAEYEAFLRNPAARKFHGSTIRGFNAGVRMAVANWSSDIASIFKREINRRAGGYAARGSHSAPQVGPRGPGPSAVKTPPY